MIKKITLLSILAISLSFSVNAQKANKINYSFSKASYTEISKLGKADIRTSESLIFKADFSKLKTSLENNSVGSTIELPYPDGTTHLFRLEKNTTMHPDLAAKYPEIKTFNAFGISHPEEFCKFDITPKGMHAMVFSSNGTYLIDPFNSTTNEYYQSYFKKNNTSDKSFECLTEASSHVDIDLAESSAAMVFGSCELRTYRLALACTGEYASFHGGTVAKALAAQVTSMNRVNGVYERTLAITMEIIANNDLLIFLNSSSDPYSNNNGGTMLGQNQTTCDNKIGSANYDIGHVFSTGGGGIASWQSVCSSSRKAQGVTGLNTPIGDNFDIDFVCHEMGHQFGANHTFANSCSGNINLNTSMEPGSGSTIMGYAGVCSPSVQAHSDDYFHGVSLQEIGTFITSGGHTCPVKTSISNSAPIISSTSTSVIIPKSTPFALTGVATDADGDQLYYLWEEMDKQKSGTGYPQSPVSTSTGGPMFRSFDPSTDPTRYFPNLNDLRKGTAPKWEVLPSVARNMRFRLTVSDYSPNGGCTINKDITVTVDGNTGPFLVLTPNTTGIIWHQSSTETITWDVAGTDGTPINCANVDIYLSTDGGITFPELLISNVPNDGSQDIVVPNLPTTTARVMVMCANGNFFDINEKNFTISSQLSTSTVSINFSIYPNPTKNIFTITTPIITNTNISVTDVTGKLIIEDKMDDVSKTIDLSSFNAGVYFVRLQNSTESSTVKIIKE